MVPCEEIVSLAMPCSSESDYKIILKAGNDHLAFRRSLIKVLDQNFQIVCLNKYSISTKWIVSTARENLRYLDTN